MMSTFKVISASPFYSLVVNLAINFPEVAQQCSLTHFLLAMRLGRWQGALVAIKVIEHDPHVDESPAAVARRIERETLCSTSLAHPNIVSTYKITTVCKGLTGPGSGLQPASDSVSSILDRQSLDFERVPDR